MKRLFILLIILSLLWVGLTYVMPPDSGLQQPKPSSTITKEQQPASEETQVAIPQTLRIPSISVNAGVESVGLDDKGRMDVPENVDGVAWYELGYKPGEKGNAVLAGHLDKVTGEPAVFWDLEQLKPGDKIYITDSQGKEYTFSVVQTQRYPYDDFPIEKVFGSAEKSMLNLITCKGTWDSAQNNYSHRIVVSSVLVN